MKHLKELAAIITKHKTKRINLIEGSRHRPENSLLYKLYDAIASLKVDTDEEAAFILYGKPVVNSKYKRIKSALRDRMINTLFFIDVRKSKYSSRTAAEATCYRNMAAIKMLSLLGASHTAAYYAKQMLREAEKYEFTEASIHALSVLCYYHVMTQVDLKKFKKYSELLSQRMETYQAEMKLRLIYEELIGLYINNKSNLEIMIANAREQIDTVKKMLETCNTEKALYFGNMAILIALSDPKYVDERIELCKSVLKKFKKKGFFIRGNAIGFLMNLSLFYMMKEDYPSANKCIREGIILTTKGKFNWFKLKELEFMLNIRKKNYKKAAQIIEEVYSSRELRKMPSHIQELWLINQGYIYLMKEIGILPDIGKPKLFKVAKFFNEVPTYSKDKRGVNIPILILQFIFWLSRKKYDRLIDCTESLRQYTYKYLRNPHLQRSNLFLKMLCVIPEVSFHPEAVRRRTEKWHKTLLQTPLEMTNQPFELEIIPYERLWEIVMSLLNRN